MQGISLHLKIARLFANTDIMKLLATHKVVRYKHIAASFSLLSVYHICCALHGHIVTNW